MSCFLGSVFRWPVRNGGQAEALSLRTLGPLSPRLWPWVQNPALRTPSRRGSHKRLLAEPGPRRFPFDSGGVFFQYVGLTRAHHRNWSSPPSERHTGWEQSGRPMSDRSRGALIPPAVGSTSEPTPMTDGGSCDANTSNSGPKRTASKADLRDHAVRLMKRRKRYSLRRCRASTRRQQRSTWSFFTPVFSRRDFLELGRIIVSSPSAIIDDGSCRPPCWIGSRWSSSPCSAARRSVPFEAGQHGAAGGGSITMRHLARDWMSLGGKSNRSSAGTCGW